VTAKINPLIAIAIPTWGKVTIAWASAFKHLGGPLGSNCIELSPVVGQPIGKARNLLMQQAVEAGCDYVFFLGDDVIPQGDAVNRLLQRMWDNPEIDMVTGMYWSKGWPTAPYIWRGMQRGPYLDWKYGEFFEIDFAGCDCLLIRLTPKMKALGPEWFSTDWSWDVATAPQMLATEDFYFYTKAREAGMKLWCDSLVQCIHEDRNSGIQYALTSEMPQYAGRPDAVLPEAKTDVAPLVKIADIGCGGDEPYLGNYEQVKIVRFDGNEKMEPDFRCDIRHLPVEDQSFDIVHSRHVIEHFGRDELMAVMKEWTRILRIGGEFRLSMPNLMYALRKILFMEEGIGAIDPYPWWQLYGQQIDEYDFHKNGFTVKRVQALLGSLGIFENIEVGAGVRSMNDAEEMEKIGQAEHDINIYATATKVKHLDRYALLPHWDRIEEQEGIKLPGRSNKGGETTATATAKAVADAEAALAKPKRRRVKVAK
jgi:predicted SAM-dependent methyltransferase